MSVNLPRISVFIPTINRAAALTDCLKSLCQQTYRNFEVIVVDGGSSDGTRDVIGQFRHDLAITHVAMAGGLVKAANGALRLASGTIFCRTDDDVVAEPGWLAAVAETFASDSSVGGVTGPTLIPAINLMGRDLTYFNERLRHSRHPFWRALAKLYYGYFMEGEPFAVGRFYRSGAFSLGSNYPDCLALPGLVEVDHLEACNWCARTDLLRQVGGFDERFRGIGEYHEPDAAYKIKKLGYRLLFNPRATVHHKPSVIGVFKARSHAFERSQNFILFYFRHIKPNTPDKAIRFFTYLAFINGYWLFKFLMTRNWGILAGVPGTFVGVVRYLPELRS